MTPTHTHPPHLPDTLYSGRILSWFFSVFRIVANFKLEGWHFGRGLGYFGVFIIRPNSHMHFRRVTCVCDLCACIYTRGSSVNCLIRRTVAKSAQNLIPEKRYGRVLSVCSTGLIVATEWCQLLSLEWVRTWLCMLPLLPGYLRFWCLPQAGYSVSLYLQPVQRSVDVCLELWSAFWLVSRSIWCSHFEYQVTNR